MYLGNQGEHSENAKTLNLMPPSDLFETLLIIEIASEEQIQLN